MAKTKKGIGKKIFLGLGIVFILLQFFMRIDKTVPEFDKGQDFMALTNPPEEVGKLLKSACYDCHSYETEYPWYSNIAPVSAWIGHHIEEGREHLNFSLWGSYELEKAEHKLEECAEETEEKKMPLSSYTITHGDASLSDEQVQLLAEWFESEMEKVKAKM